MKYPEYRDKVIELGEAAFEMVIKDKSKEIKSRTPLMIEYARL